MNRPTLLLLLLSCLWLAPAQAATTCTASMTALSFGDVNPFGGDVTASATLSYTCSSSGLLGLGLYGAKVTMCLSIASGAQGTGSLVPRRMTSGASAMNFNIYKDAAYSQIWGQRSGTAAADSVLVQLTVPVTLGSGSASGSVTAYGRVPGAQNSLIPGSYSNLFSGANTELSYRYNEGLLGSASQPANCSTGAGGGGTATFPFTASASVQKQCTPSFTVHDVDFGSHGTLSASIDTSATMSPQCTNTTPYNVGLDDGQNASGGARRMKSAGGAYVGYELYRDNARTQRWGHTIGTDTVAETGNGTAQTKTVYGRVAAQPTPAAGGYSDTVTVTITY